MMFQWDEKRLRLNIPARQVLRLERSLSDVQVSLPGLEPQPATAYLCVFHVSGGLRVAIILHLHEARRLAIYLNREGPLGKDEACRVLGEANHFAETLGFMLGNLDFVRMPEPDRDRFWQSLPLMRGVPAPTGMAPDVDGKAADSGGAPVSPLKKGWTVAEMKIKRRNFIENLGRLLGML
ncbi:hypothetical protein [Geothermobacter hydrogeniphilus]|nr:hypothetical protein [Geothermobacter hydrogeniphilus]